MHILRGAPARVYRVVNFASGAVCIVICDSQLDMSIFYQGLDILRIRSGRRCEVLVSGVVCRCLYGNKDRARHNLCIRVLYNTSTEYT